MTAPFEIRVTTFAARLMREVKEELNQLPHSRDNVYVVLNALAAVAATVITGTEDTAAQRFFSDALQQQLDEFAAK